MHKFDFSKTWIELLIELQDQCLVPDHGKCIKDFDEVSVRRGDDNTTLVWFDDVMITVEPTEEPWYGRLHTKGVTLLHLLNLPASKLPYGTDDLYVFPTDWLDTEDFSFYAMKDNAFINSIQWYEQIDRNVYYVWNFIGYMQLQVSKGQRPWSKAGIIFPAIVKETSVGLTITSICDRVSAAPPRINIPTESWKLLDEKLHEDLVGLANVNFAMDKACKNCARKGRETIVLDWVTKCNECGNMTWEWAFNPEGQQVPYLTNVIGRYACNFGHDFVFVNKPFSLSDKLTTMLPTILHELDRPKTES